MKFDDFTVGTVFVYAPFGGVGQRYRVTRPNPLKGTVECVSVTEPWNMFDFIPAYFGSCTIVGAN